MTAQGNAIDNRDDHWIVLCPVCQKEHEYQGYFDPSDVTKCSCGTEFTTEKVWLNDNEYME